jgi:hypothetical protein
MFNNIISIFNELDIKIKKIMKYGFIFSISFCLLATIILLTYEMVYASPDLYYIGLKMVQTGLFFIVEFVVCGIAMDKIKKQLI